MNRKTATLVGAAAALAAGPALATQPPTPAVPAASSYAELLQPIPNAAERLRLADAESEAQQPRLIPAQYNGANNHHHHHHHHHARAWWMAHGYYWHGGRWILRPRPHHHHHHNNY